MCLLSICVLNNNQVCLHPPAFAKGTCYSPFVKYGNFSSSDPGFGVGAVVEFACDPGYTLEQGSIIIECVDVQNPQWNETEPACRGGATSLSLTLTQPAEVGPHLSL